MKKKIRLTQWFSTGAYNASMESMEKFLGEANYFYMLFSFFSPIFSFTRHTHIERSGVEIYIVFLKGVKALKRLRTTGLTSEN